MRSVPLNWVPHNRGMTAGGYIEAGGLRTFHLVAGEGDPLLLLHGGLGSAESWAAQVPALSECYRVHVPERRGHGRTADVPGPLTYAAMADDTIAYLEALGLAAVHLVGWSDGAAVAALVAIKRPDLTRSLVSIGQHFEPDGERGEARALREVWSAEAFPGCPPGLFDKSADLWRREPRIPMTELARIRAATLVMQGDDDVVRVEHSAKVARTIPHAQLAVVPGTSHALPVEKPDLVNRLILDFLASPQPARLMPLSS